MVFPIAEGFHHTVPSLHLNLGQRCLANTWVDAVATKVLPDLNGRAIVLRFDNDEYTVRGREKQRTAHRSLGGMLRRTDVR